jgi:putative tricarboxylic transport membrane protein
MSSTEHAAMFRLSRANRVSAVIVAIGASFLILSMQTESTQDDLIGPRMVPNALAILVVALGLLQATINFFSTRRGTAPEDSKQEPDYRMLGAVVGLAVFYLAAFILTGYLLSTAMTLAGMVFLFGTRNARVVATVTVAGTLVFYVGFVRIMGIYDPPGLLINVQPFMPF